ncbi:hypothetical protein BH10CYA1_BH10CYA1_15820 [soil metagenome]
MQDDANLPAQWAKEDTSHLEVGGSDGDPNDYSQPFIIYADRKQAIRKLNKRMIFAAPLVILYAIFVSSMHMYIVAALLIAQLVGMYLWVVRAFNKSVTPLMHIDATGITIHGLVTHLHMDWDNLKEVRPYTFMYKYVGLDAKSVWKLDASVTMKVFLAYNSFVRFFYRLIGIKLSGINIPEQYSHFKAEDICEQIERRREHYLGLPSHEKTLQAQAEAKLASPQPEATLKLPNAEQKLKLPNSED